MDKPVVGGTLGKLFGPTGKISRFVEPSQNLLIKAIGKENAQNISDPGHVFEGITYKKAEAARLAQEKSIAAQEQRQKQRLAEAESEVATRIARAKKAGGRSLLIKTSPRGVQTLGGI